jgi:hypothetical protein
VFVPGKPPVDYQGARDVKPIVEFALSQVCCIGSYIDGHIFPFICLQDIFQSLLLYTTKLLGMSYVFSVPFSCAKLQTSYIYFLQTI